MITKVGVYTRLSDEDRFKANKNDDSNSIVNQKSMCVKYAAQNGWNVVDIYSDDDFSGAGTYRPEFERLMKDCEKGRINLVLCKSQSRFSRDMEVIERYLHNKFIEWGVRFVSIIDNADTNNEANKKSRQINGLINEWYLEDLSQNIKKSLKNKRDDGLFMGSFAPYGYQRSENDKHKLVIDPVAAEVVKKIFELYVSGLGYYKICEHLNNLNIPTPAQYKKQCGSNFVCGTCDYDKVVWTKDTVATILKNEVYIGNLVQGKKTSLSYKVHKSKKVPKQLWCRTENAHEPIITKEVWNTVQKRLNSHECPTRCGEIHYLSRKVYCSECQKAFIRNTYKVKSSPNGRRIYLQCKGAKQTHTCQNKKSIKLQDMEKILLDAINDLLKKYYDKELLQEQYKKLKINNINLEQIKILENEKNNINKKIEENKSYYRKLYEDKVKGIITDDMFKMLSSDYLKEIDTMINREKKLDEEIIHYKQTEDNKKQTSEVLKKYNKITKLNKVIVDEFIDKIYIGSYDKETNTRNINIVWNFLN